MKERPILFSAPMVRAILEGRKTMTRRVIKPQPPEWVKCYNSENNGDHFFCEHDCDDDMMLHWPSYDVGLRCPYGVIGDRLWVRETFGICDFPGSGTSFGKRKILYRADGETTYDIGKWKPSIFMRREYSRITLEIEKVRVERLRDIIEDDAKKEGVNWYPSLKPIVMFQDLWQSINGPGSWDANPWVWVIEFKRVTP